MKSEEIKLEIKKHMTQVQLAKKLNISQPTVHEIIWKKKRSYKKQKFIAELIGKSFEEVWG